MLRNEVGACIGATMGLLGLWGWVGCNAAAPPDPPAVALECEANGYPCSLSKVGLDVLMRGEALRDELVAMLDSNGSMDAALAFVRGQADVVDAASSDFALRVRLAGGRDMWVVRGDSLAPVLESPLVDTSGAEAARLPHVVGDTPESKHALVLSPFKYDFDVNDEGFALAQMLESVRGYEGNVTYLSNVSAGSNEVGISNFLGWEGYDLIHVSSHGKTICQGENCSAVIFTGDRYANANQLLQITEAGVNTVAVTGSDIRLLAVGEDFFRQHYPGGLERTIVFFNACHTFGAEDMGLGLALAGSTSVFLGWNQPVMADAAYAAGLAFHRSLAEGGITATSAYRALEDLRYNNFKYKRWRVLRESTHRRTRRPRPARPRSRQTRTPHQRRRTDRRCDSGGQRDSRRWGRRSRSVRGRGRWCRSRPGGCGDGDSHGGRPRVHAVAGIDR